MNLKSHKAVEMWAIESLRELLFSSRQFTMLLFNVYVRSSRFNLGYWDLTTVALKNALDKCVENGQKVLEVGAGPFAILSIHIAKKKRVEITAVDIYAEFIENAKKTAKYNGVFINFLTSDLLSNVRGSFDIVFFNPPYLPTEYARQMRGNARAHIFRLICDGGPSGCETIRRFLKQVPVAMHKKSKVLLGFNGWFVSPQKMEKLVHENGFKLVSVFSSFWNPSQVFAIEKEQ